MRKRIWRCAALMEFICRLLAALAWAVMVISVFDLLLESGKVDGFLLAILNIGGALLMMIGSIWLIRGRYITDALMPKKEKPSQ